MSPEELLKKYPYFAFAALQALKEAETPEEKTRLKGILSANIGSESDLREIIGLNSESFVNFYPDEEQVKLSTDETIDSFIEKFGSSEAAIAQPPVSDYASTLLAEDPDAPLPDLGLPEDSVFLKPTPKTSPAADTSAEDEKTDDIQIEKDITTDETRIEKIDESDKTPAEGLTESFAKILIKNHNSSKAS